MPAGVALASLDSRDILNTLFELTNAVEDASWANTLGMRVPSDRGIEEYASLGNSPGLREWLADRQPQKHTPYSYTLRNKLYESTIEVGVLDKRRDKTGMIGARLAEHAERCGSHWEDLLTTVIEAGAAAGSLGIDGVPFYDDAHVVGGASDGYINDLTVTQVAALNVNTTTAPTASELADAISGVLAYQYGYRDEGGKFCNQNGKSFIFMFPLSWGASPYNAIANQYLTNGVSNNLVGIMQMKGITIMPMVNPRMAATTVFHFFRADSAMKPFILQDEIPLTPNVLAEGSEEEFRNFRHLYGLHASRAVGYGRWQSASKCTLS